MPGAEKNTSFLVFHPSSGVHTVNTVWSQLKLPDSQLHKHRKTGIELLCRVQAGVVWVVKMAMLI